MPHRMDSKLFRVRAVPALWPLSAPRPLRGRVGAAFWPLSAPRPLRDRVRGRFAAALWPLGVPRRGRFLAAQRVALSGVASLLRSLVVFVFIIIIKNNHEL